MQIEVPIPKENFFWGGGSYGLTYGGMAKHTDIGTWRGVKFHLSTYHLSPVSAVQCSAALHYCAVQGNRPVMPRMTRDKTGTTRVKTGTSRDKTGTRRDKTGTAGTKQGQ